MRATAASPGIASSAALAPMDIMGHLVHCCLERGRALMTGRYGYSFPRILAEAAGAEIILVDEDSFTHDVDEFLGAVTPRAAMVCIANPNNPTGTAVPISDIRRLAAAIASLTDTDHVLDVPNRTIDLRERLRARGILLLRLANFGLARHPRITIGLPEDTEAFDRALTDLLAGK